MINPYNEFTKNSKLHLDKIKNNSQCFNDRIFQYIGYGMKRLGIELDNKTKEIYQNLRVDDFFENKNPVSIASGFVYLIAVKKEKNITQRDITDVFLVTESTIQKAYKELLLAKAVIEVFGTVLLPRYSSIHKKVKGLYTILSVDKKVDFSKIPKSQIRKSCYFCQRKFWHNAYACKVCSKAMFHLQEILEHYKTNKIHRKQLRLQNKQDVIRK